MSQLQTPSKPDLDALGSARGTLLRQLGLLDEAFEHEFDELLELATFICGKPLGAMTLLDERTQLMKARIGFKGSRTMPIRDSICQYTVRGSHMLIVEDTREDPRFRDNKTLQEDTGIRFYAGMPVIASSGVAVGALCVMDTQPATLNEEQQRALEILARQVSTHIRLRERAATVTRMAQEQERVRTLLYTVLNNIPVEVHLKDEEGHFRFYNRAVAQRFGISDTEWLGKTSRDLWPAEIAETIMREEAEALQGDGTWESYIDLPESQGGFSHWKTLRAACDDADGRRVLATVGIDLTDEMERQRELQEIQEQLEEANRKLNSLALTDALTGLWNRRAFDSQLETAVIASQRSHKPLALLILDVDNFKTINDRFGHPYGDLVLRSVGTILNRVKRAEDVACRFGGEEFAVLLPGTDGQGALLLAQRVLEAMRAYPWDKEVVTASIGLAMCNDTCSSDELLDSADSALYRSKREGKNRATCATCDM